MTRTATPFRSPQSSRTSLEAALPGLPRSPMTAEQQLAALKRVQEQADQRVKLGAQFFKAAEARTGEYKQILEQIKTEQENLRGQMQQDITRSFHTYDQWVGNVEDNLTTSIQGLESKIAKLQTDWTQTQQRIDTMMKRSEVMLDQCRTMLSEPGRPGPGSPDAGNDDSMTTASVTSISAADETLEIPAPPEAPESSREIATIEPAAAPLEEPPAPKAELLHPAPPPQPAARNESPAPANPITDAITSTDGDIESPEFYRQVLEKLREQDETGT